MNCENEKQTTLVDNKEDTADIEYYSDDDDAPAKVDDEEEEEEDVQRTCWSRFFGKVSSGSLRGSIFSMASITFGSGCLAFPYAIMQAGPIISLVLFVVVVLYSYFTLYVLLISGRKLKKMDYNSLVLATMNKKAVIISDICNIILCLGTIMSYQYIVSKFSLSLLHQVFHMSPENDTLAKIIQMASLGVFIQIPISCLKNISKLQYASMVGAACLIITIVVVIVEMPFYFYQNFAEVKKINLFPRTYLSVFDTLSVFLYGFSSHNGIFQIYQELRKPNLRRSIKVLNRSIWLEIGMYFSIAFFGYFSTMNHTPDIIILRKDLHGYNDYVIKVAMLCLIICLNCSMAINYNIMRMSFRTTIIGREYSTVTDVLITILVYAISNTLTFFVKNITDILGIIGGICVVLICFVNPTIVYIKSNGKPLKSFGNVLAIVSMIVISISGLGATAHSIYNFIQQLNRH